ncbi:MAG: TetR/AcrR family transcriptional regulator [Gemmatimonadota bacterium]|nr:MAG: TetR/AcrR family transcriptional regulator [Gemmatimonadota bacterium]
MTTQRKEAKRERILDAAVLEIARRGYYGTTVSTIARRAGVADGTIYLYFKSKEDLLVSIFERAMQRFNFEAAGIVEADGVGAEEKLRRFVALHLSLLGEDRDLAVIFQVEFRHTLHILERLSRSRMRDYLALIARVLEQGTEEGVFKRDLDALLAAKMVFGILDEMATDWVLSKKNTRLASRSAPVTDLLLGGLRTS